MWETHARLELSSDRNFVVQAVGDATLILNGQAVKSAALRNGDSIALGSLELTCWLSPARHRSLALSESMTWTIILSVLMGQVAMIYWLLNRS